MYRTEKHGFSTHSIPPPSPAPDYVCLVPPLLADLALEDLPAVLPVEHVHHRLLLPADGAVEGGLPLATVQASGVAEKGNLKFCYSP